MGQKQRVMVHRLLSEDSIDERMLEVLQGKTDIFNRFAQESVAGERLKEMSEEGSMKLIIRAELERYQEEMLTQGVPGEGGYGITEKPARGAPALF